MLGNTRRERTPTAPQTGAPGRQPWAPMRSRSKSAASKALSWIALGICLTVTIALVQLPDPVQAQNAGVVSDEFDGSELDGSVWRWVDPRGDSSVAVTGSALELSVPGGVSHNLWTNQNWAPRVLQQVADGDFEIEAKFDGPVTEKYQMQGLIAQQDTDRFVRTDIYHDGSSARIFVARFSEGKGTNLYDAAIPGGVPVWLRLARAGDEWTVRYSHDGQAWETAKTFSFSLALDELGLFAGNHHTTASSVPAFTASVDHFRNVATIDPEPQPSAPVISDVTVEPTADAATVSWTTDVDADSHVAHGPTTDYELGTVSDPTLTTSHRITLDNLDCATTYHYQAASTNDAGTTTTDDATFTTTACPTDPDGPTIDAWYGPTQSFGQLGNAQRWVTILGNVTGSAGVDSLSYTLNGGLPQALTIGPNDRRLAEEGDFAIELDYQDLRAGDNTVVITATDANGATAEATVTVDYTAGHIWPLPYSGSWSGQTLLDVAQPVDGRWSIQGDTIRTEQVGYDRLLTLGDITWSDYEVETPITLHQVDPNGDGYGWPSNGPALGLGLRWSGHGGGEQPRQEYWPTGAFAWYQWGGTSDRFALRALNSSSYGPNHFYSDAVNFQEGETWIYKVRVQTQPDGSHQYKFRMWKDTEPEPGKWLLSIDSPSDHPTNGSVLLVAHEVDASFGAVTVRPVE